MTNPRKLKSQSQVQITFHEMELALDSFYSTLEPLEEYIGKVGYYSDWNERRQIYRKVIEDSNDTPAGFEDLFLTDLFVFKTQIRKKPTGFREKLQKEFYKWVDATKIDAKNCPDKLKHFLFEINEVLEGRGENIVNQTRELIKGQELTPQEALGMYGQLHIPVNKNRKREEDLAGKKWNRDLDNEERISGNPDRGKEVIRQIYQEISYKHADYDLYLEQKKLRGIGEQRKQNPNYNPLIDDPSEEYENLPMEGIETQSRPYEKELNEALWKLDNWKGQDYQSSGETREGLQGWVALLKIVRGEKEWRITCIKNYKGNWANKEQWNLALVHHSADLNSYDNQNYLFDLPKDPKKLMKIHLVNSRYYTDEQKKWIKEQWGIKKQRIDNYWNLSKLEIIELFLDLEDKNRELKAEIQRIKVKPNKTLQDQQQTESMEDESYRLEATLNSVVIPNDKPKNNSLPIIPIISVIGVISLLGLIIYKVKKNKIKN